MEIAMGAIGPLLPKLRELLMGELTMEKKVRKGIESLVTELKLMHAVLSKVAKVPADQLDEGVKIWAGNVKELSYQMEDIVDAFMVRVEDGGEPANPKNRVKKIVKKVKKLFKNGKDLHRISDALEEVVVQAKQLAELRQRYEQETRDTSSNTSVDPRMVALYTDVTELVGIEETRDQLINMLIGGDDWSKHPLKTVSIVGFGGLGKTTLARAAYDKIKLNFDCGAFVSVSQNPNIKKILKSILFELDKVKYADIYNVEREETHLIDELIEFLHEKRYLIIIDDIWDKEVWKLIKCAFSKKSPGSRLITTTRVISVSEACCPSRDDIYKMKPLSNDVSRTLFCKRVFSDDKVCPQELVQVTEDILKKCGGIPLAIITIASLLASNDQIKTKDQWYALLNSIGRGLTEDRSVEEMKKILLFSYYDLPSYLKPCLLYLSIFPEDHEIRRDRLIWRWISEGFVYSEKKDISLYELGDSYFNELVNRNMIQPIDIGYDEKVNACRVHDMVLDLICSLSSEENFVTILDDTRRKMGNSEIKVRRLSIQNSKIDVDTTRMEHMRSVTVFSDNVVGKVLDISKFEVLRVLDLEGCKDVSDVRYVGNLLHLRYLGLRNTHVKDLPMEIGKLQFLLTLDLRGTKIKVLPSSVVQLRRLMCLYVGHVMKLPSGIGNLTSLEVLDELGLCEVDLDFVKELGHLTKLRVLRLYLDGLDESLGKALEESIGHMDKLNSLSVYVDRGLINVPSEDWVPPPQLRRLVFQSGQSWFEKLPSWISPSSLPLLSYLEITVFEVRSEAIQLLGTLPALVYLKIWDYSVFPEAHEVEAPVLSSGALFPCATECRFYGIGAVPSTFPQGAAPRLKHLRFALPAKWVSRESFDLGMRHLPSLERVEVDVIKKGATSQEVDEAEAAVRAAADDHPNRPVLRFR
ncbi:disease resistance protein RGA5-like [Hordeum vulgare subsp. vulgare]|uniref:RGH1 n=1 Tax=Hordeum vulgare subsp. vulgare TaxID=112509 RepID=A0A287MIX9_HORVV|nr:disease resistance protein RGA5-like [Hordeum vulgare subsp. vulgare]